MNQSSFFKDFSKDAKATLLLAFPMMMGQVGQILLSVVDTIMVARVSTEALAGVSFGGGLMLFLLIIAMGLCSAIHVAVSHVHGKEAHLHGPEILKHGFWIVVSYSVPLALLISTNIHWLGYFGQPIEILEHAKPYVSFFVWSIVPALIFRVFRNYAEAFGKPWTPFWVTTTFVVLNVFLNWVFIFGNLGAEPMGAAGAGLATLLSRVFGMLLMIVLVVFNPFYRIKFNFYGFFKLRWIRLRAMLHVGIVTMIQIAFEFGFFTMAVVMMGWLGAQELASQQVITNYTGVIFMIPLSIAFATTIRVGQAKGRKDDVSAKSIAISSMIIATCIMFVAAIVTFLVRNELPKLFVQDPAVIAMVAPLLIIVALVQLGDGLQVTAMGALRGIPDLRIPLYVVITAYWLIGIPFAYYLAFVKDYGAAGIWWGLFTGVAVAGGSLLMRFLYIFKSSQSPQ